MAKIVGKHLVRLNPHPLAKEFHIPPDVAAIQRFSVFAYKNWSGLNAGLFHIASKKLLQRHRDEDAPCFIFAVDNRFALPNGFCRNKPRLTDADLGTADGLNQQGKTGFPRCPY